MKTVLALSGSNSKNSINKRLVQFVADQLTTVEVKFQDWINFEVPIYGIDLEEKRGIPADIRVFKNILDEYEVILLSVNEHNLSVSSFFKNILDWTSRLDQNFLKDKKIFLMSTSESEEGASEALDYMAKVIPTFGGEVVESFSLNSFSQNFDIEKQELTDDIMKLGLMDVVSNFERVIRE